MHRIRFRLQAAIRKNSTGDVDSTEVVAVVAGEGEADAGKPSPQHPLADATKDRSESWNLYARALSQSPG